MFKDRLLVGTNNPHKLLEFRRLFTDAPFEVLSPHDLGIHLDVIEDGATYLDNATIKARAFAGASGLLSMADDSGIEVDALNGRPGIRSARYGGPSLDDDGRVSLLLDEMRNVEDANRGCRYVAVLVLSWPPRDGEDFGRSEFFTGTCEGIIARERAGVQGFGYDPVFTIPGLNVTIAQIDGELKDTISHRGLAARKAAEFLQGYVSGSANV